MPGGRGTPSSVALTATYYAEELAGCELLLLLPTLETEVVIVVFGSPVRTKFPSARIRMSRSYIMLAHFSF